MIKFFFLTIIFVYWISIFPGMRGANDFPYAFKESVSVGFNLPYVWSQRGSEGLGQYIVATLWAYPIDVLYGVGAKIGLDFWLLQKLIGVLPILLLGSLGIFKLLEYYKITGWAKVIGGTFFLTNTYILQLVDGGQLSIGLCYSWIPTCFLLILKSLNGSLKSKFIAAVSVILLGFFDIRFIYILFIILFVHFIFTIIFEKKSNVLNSILNWGQIGLLFAIFFIGLNFYWLLPLILAKASFLPPTYTRESQLSFLNFASIGHAILLQQPHWYQNIFGQVSNLKAEFILLPVMALLAIFLRKRNKVVGFWLLILLIGIFLVKGSNEPFGNFYKWLFNNLPGFSLFRDSTKFFVFICLSYSILIAVFIQEIIKLDIKNVLLNKVMKRLQFFVLIYLILLANPAYLGKMSGLLSFPNYQKEYFQSANLLKQDLDFSRILWIPRKSPLGYSSPTHPILEATNLVEKRPFAIGSVGAYEVLNFLREASFSGQLLDVAGVGYLAFPPLDSKREEVNEDKIKYYYTFLNQIEHLAWVEGRVKNSAIPIIKTKEHQQKLFLAPNLYWVIGSDDIYKESTKSAALSLSKNAFIFAEEYPGLINQIDKTPQAKIILNNKTNLDLAAAFIKEKDLIFPAQLLNFEPNESGWWKRETEDLIFWKNFLDTKHHLNNLDFDLKGGWAIAEGSLELNIQKNNISKGKVLLARVMESSRSGVLIFEQDKKVIGQIPTLTSKEGKPNIRWFEIGKVSDGILVIKTGGDINMVNALALVDEVVWNEYKEQADLLDSKITNLNEAETITSSAVLSFKQINPTKIEIVVSNLDRPMALVFSQSYDPLWKLNNKNSLPIYSLLNGFLITENGEYILEYEAQKYIYLGLIVSGITIVAVSVIFLIKKTYV